MATDLHQRHVMGQTAIRTEESDKCSIHRNKDVVFVCSDCNELICTTCCVSGHRNHTLEEIAAVNSRQRDKLVDFINDTEENKLPELQKELESIEQKVVETKHNFGTVLPEQIQERGTLYKTDIDRYISQLKSRVQEKKNENIELLLIYKNKIQKRYEHLVQLTKECKHVLQSGTSVLIFDKVKDVECLKSEPFRMPDISQHMEQTIGTLETCTTKCKLGIDISLQMKQALGILCGCFLVLVCVIFMTYLAIFDVVGRNCTKMSTLVAKSDGSALFHDKNSNTTLHLHDGITDDLPHYWNMEDISWSRKMDTSWVFCLHVTKNEHLVVGGSGLKIYTKEGTVRHIANDISFLYMVPVRIVECPITGNLAVVRVHMLIPWMSDIAVYDKTLTVLFYYELPGASWSPVVSIAYDSFGNIVIGESRTKTVYVISGTGQYIKNLFDVKGELRSIAIQTPCNILWAAVQHDIPMNRTEVTIEQRLLDLPNPSNKCKRHRQNLLKTVYTTTKDRERKCDFMQDMILYIKDFLFLLDQCQ